MIGGKGGTVNCSVDLDQMLVDVEVQPSLAIHKTVVSISVFDFLDIAGKIQTAMNGKVKAAVTAVVSGALGS